MSSRCSRMPSWLSILLACSLAVIGAARPTVARGSELADEPGQNSGAAEDQLPRSDAEWQRKLTPQQFRVLRKKQTERAFSGKYWKTKRPGVYLCAGCDQALFASKTKFDSGTGWPSFWAPIEETALAQRVDNSEYPPRMEVVCSRCDGHLGHVFADGPAPTGLRFCINSAALKLDEKSAAAGTKAKAQRDPNPKAETR